jgi:hypothetical protein
MRYYIYKLTFLSGRTYIGQHTERKANDKYVTSSAYYKRNPSDSVVSREILLEVKDKETLNIMETICIMADKRDNDLNVNGTLGGLIMRYHYTGPRTDEWKQNISKSRKGSRLSTEHKRKISESKRGKPSWNKGLHPEQQKHSDEWKLQNSKRMKQEWDSGKRQVSEAFKQAARTSAIGRKWFTDGIVCVMAFECPQGFRPGRIITKK